MIYILIIFFASNQKATALSVDFNTLTACQAAAAEITRQVLTSPHHQPIIMCAAKGQTK